MFLVTIYKISFEDKYFFSFKLFEPNTILRNPIRLLDPLYLELYITKKYKNLI